ncbi:MAG: hypothetical protein AAF744_01070 [Pseudomonadota bacterium]
MMKTMMSAIVVCTGLAVAAPALAQSEKARVCATNGLVAGAVQQARLDGVAKRKVRETVAAANPDLSENVLAIVPQFADAIYGMKKRDLRQINMRTVIEEQCVANWEQIKATRNSITN